MSRVPVLVVGAGPTGLMLSIELARRGIGFRLVDRHPQPLGWDRATVVKPRSMELFDGLDLADAFLGRGAIVSKVAFFLNGAPVADIAFGDLDSRYSYLLSLSESDTEAILTGKLVALGGAVERDLELVGLAQTGTGVTARLRKVSMGEETVAEADWLVGTDGLHSAVREAVADPFEGHDNPLLWAVVDARIRGWQREADAIAVQIERPAVNPIPLRDGRWRIYFRPENADAGALETLAAGLALLSPGADLGDHDEPRFFHTHARVARRYRVGRVLLAGDAAHVCSPIQGHGMNVGIQDAHNLGWKLALVAGGHAPQDLLDSYEAERRPIAQAIVASGDEAEKRFGGRDSDIDDAVRRLMDVENRRRAVVTDSEIGHCYRRSPIVLETTPGGSGPEDATPVGCRVGDADPIIHLGRHLRLHELLRAPEHTLFAMAGDGDSSDVGEAVRRAVAIAKRHVRDLRAFAVVRGAPRAGRGTEGVLYDPDGSLHRRLCPDRPGLCLIRPDGHLGFRSGDLSPDRLDAYLSGIFVSTPSPASRPSSYR